MQNTDVYLGKIYKQIIYLVKKNLNIELTTDLKQISEDTLLDMWRQFCTSLNELERRDKDFFFSLVPDIFKNSEEVVEITKLQNAFEEVFELITKFDDFYSLQLQKIIETYNEEFNKRGFEGEYPKYYKYIDGEMYYVEYDEDIFLEKDQLVSSRIGVITKILKFDEEFLNCNIEEFTYLDLFFDYPEQAQKGLLRNFVIYLPDLIMTEEITAERLNDDLRYFEIIDAALTKQKKLPKWYLSIRRTIKDFRKLYFMISLIIVFFILSIINYFAFDSKITTLIIIWIAGGVIDYFVCDYFAKKTYQKYHPMEKNK